MKKSRLLGAVCVLLVIASVPVSAAIVEYQIRGVVNAVATPLQGGPVNIGDDVTGSFFVDTIAFNEPDNTLAFYRTSNLTLNIGSSYVVTAPQNSGSIAVFNNYGGSANDRVQIDFTQPNGLFGPTINSTWDPDYFHQQFYGNGEYFSSNALPLTIDVNQTRGSALRFNVDDSVQIEFSLTQLSAVVPIPAAVWLFGSGLLGLIGMARRKKA